MDEVIVRVLRTVACRARLRLLSHLLGTREATPSQLAQALGMSLDLVSAHLARLTGAGLITRRRSGLRCFCIARSPYRDTAFSSQVLAWLRETLSAPSRAGQRPSGASATREAPTARLLEAHATVFHAVTAFTNLRRLQILRRLADGEPAAGAALVRELRMSGAALCRHMRKLARRGYIRSTSRKGKRLYQLSRDGATPSHARLLTIVAAHGPERELHT